MSSSFDDRFGKGPFVHFGRDIEESALTFERLGDAAFPEEKISLLIGQRIDDGVVAVLPIIIAGLFRLEPGVNQCQNSQCLHPIPSLDRHQDRYRSKTTDV